MESNDDVGARDWGSGGRLTVDLAALGRNWKTLATLAGDAETGAAVKGDAYGLGLEPAARALALSGCRTFFVALPDEGFRLRAALPQAVIYVLNGLAPGAAPHLAAADLRPVLGSLAEIEDWAAYRNAGGTGLAALHVDTGMNRLGVTLDEAARLSGRAGSLGLTLVMSHLACADRAEHPLNASQLAAFRQAAALFPELPASLANSAGLHLGPDYRFDLARPGIALYGGRFSQEHPPLETVVRLEARVIQVRAVAAGETVGYGAMQTMPRAGLIAILSAGYADGYHRKAGSSDGARGASTYLRGCRAPLVGRISMDLMAVDVTDIPDAARGDLAELFGPNVPVDEVAGFAGTIGYELLTSLGHRYRRHYIGAA